MIQSSWSNCSSGSCTDACQCTLHEHQGWNVSTSTQPWKQQI